MILGALRGFNLRKSADTENKTPQHKRINIHETIIIQEKIFLNRCWTLRRLNIIIKTRGGFIELVLD